MKMGITWRCWASQGGTTGRSGRPTVVENASACCLGSIILVSIHRVHVRPRARGTSSRGTPSSPYRHPHRHHPSQHHKGQLVCERRMGFMYLMHARLHSGDDVNLGISIQISATPIPHQEGSEDGEGGTAGGGWHLPG
jgi:hypothetical protein